MKLLVSEIKGLNCDIHELKRQQNAKRRKLFKKFKEDLFNKGREDVYFRELNLQHDHTREEESVALNNYFNENFGI